MKSPNQKHKDAEKLMLSMVLLNKKQKEAMKFLQDCGGCCGWDEEGLTVEISENLVDLAFMGLVESFLETETWMFTHKGEEYVTKNSVCPK